MRILVVGGSGLIGAYVIAHLTRAGHQVVGAARDVDAARRRRPEVGWVRVDLGATPVSSLVAMLGGADAVVNCAGALQDCPRDNLRAVHVDGVAQLAQACAMAGVSRFVHISAAGVGPGRTTAFNATKAAAEAMLRASDLDWVILRPGLVLAPTARGGTELLRGLAAFPLAIPVAHPRSIVQVVSVEDVAKAVAAAVLASAPARISVDLVHRQRLDLATFLSEIRRWLGLPAAPLAPLPPTIAMAAGRAADVLAQLGWRTPMRTKALEHLRMGIEGDGAAAERHLGVSPRSLGEMLSAWPVGAPERSLARLYFVKPLALATLASFWLVSGIVGLARLQAAALILSGAGATMDAARGAVICGSLADLALCFKRSARLAARGMLAISAIYLVGGTLLRPDLWLDPLGPWLKVIPAAILALAALAMLDDRP